MGALACRNASVLLSPKSSLLAYARTASTFVRASLYGISSAATVHSLLVVATIVNLELRRLYIQAALQTPNIESYSVVVPMLQLTC